MNDERVNIYLVTINAIKKFFLFLCIGCEPVILSEDTMLCGFVPLLSAPFNTTYVHCTVDKVSDSPPSAAHSSHTACTKSKVVAYYVHSTVDKVSRLCYQFVA